MNFEGEQAYINQMRSKALKATIRQFENTVIQPALNVVLAKDTDPTPDQLLEWVSREINGYARDTHHPMGCDSPTDLAQRIIDTVKRVTG